MWLVLYKGQAWVASPSLQDIKSWLAPGAVEGLEINKNTTVIYHLDDMLPDKPATYECAAPRSVSMVRIPLSALRPDDA